MFGLRSGSIDGPKKTLLALQNIVEKRLYDALIVWYPIRVPINLLGFRLGFRLTYQGIIAYFRNKVEIEISTIFH